MTDEGSFPPTMGTQLGGQHADFSENRNGEFSGDGEQLVELLLTNMSKHKASDLHLKTGAKPRLRIHGELRVLKHPPISKTDMESIAAKIIPSRFFHTNEVKGSAAEEHDFAYTDREGNRYRVSVFTQRNTLSMVFRTVLHHPPSIEELRLPEVVKTLCHSMRGLILVTGPTGSGKSTTLAAMVREINENKPYAITTIEDPIEILHDDLKSLVTQREVGVDTESFLTGLRSVLRQNPNVIMVGEIRDLETLRTALSAAQSGHLVLSTAHTLDARETINRMVEMFPLQERHQARVSLGGSLRGIICQRLVMKKNGSGRIAVFEILVNNGRVFESITDADSTKNITQIIEESSYDGMQTFDQNIMELIKENEISVEDALTVANNPHNIKTKLVKNGYLS